MLNPSRPASRPRLLLGLLIAGALSLGGIVAWVAGKKHWPREQDFANGIGMEMVWCEPGSFMMGSPASEPGRQDDETSHEVTLSQGFWLGRYEVTQEEWTRLMGSNPSSFSKREVLWVFNLPNHQYPVETVSWEQALEFCKRLTEMERTAGRLKEGWAYTLPSEAQWEYACRAGTTGSYAGPDLDKLGWHNGNSGGHTTHPVGQKEPNGWGFYDMHGNVWEWCLDGYGEYEQKTVTDPTGPKEQATFRLIRGGGWYYDARVCRSASRDRWQPDFRYSLLGFRPVLSAQVPAGAEDSAP